MEAPKLSNDVQGLASDLVGMSEGGFPEGCSSIQATNGGAQMMEDPVLSLRFFF